MVKQFLIDERYIEATHHHAEIFILNRLCVVIGARNPIIIAKTQFHLLFACNRIRFSGLYNFRTSHLILIHLMLYVYVTVDDEQL